MSVFSNLLPVEAFFLSPLQINYLLVFDFCELFLPLTTLLLFINTALLLSLLSIDVQYHLFPFHSHSQ